jgi:ADP-ribose pyrophosphatase YjhB (NUDIX family)
MKPREYLGLLYERIGSPALANFSLCDLGDGVDYQFGAFALADHNSRVVLIRRTPIKEYPGIENYWWIPGGGMQADEPLDETAMREFEEETGLQISVKRILLAQLAEDRPFIAVFFRGTVTDGTVTSDADPDRITAEVRSFPVAGVPFDMLWTDQDKILLVQEGFAAGQVDDLIVKNGLKREVGH